MAPFGFKGMQLSDFAFAWEWSAELFQQGVEFRFHGWVCWSFYKSEWSSPEVLATASMVLTGKRNDSLLSPTLCIAVGRRWPRAINRVSAFRCIPVRRASWCRLTKRGR